MRKLSNVRTKALTKVWRNPIYFLAFGFGAGLIKRAPGTYGTLVAIPLYCLLSYSSDTTYIITLGFGFLIGVYICQTVCDELGLEDYPGIVWDEIVGYLTTMFLLPVQPIWIILGFVLFRFLDIFKPQPLGWVDQHISGGWGIMLDDLLAGVIACAILHLLKWGLNT